MKIRVWLFASFILAFCAIGAAIWIMAGPAPHARAASRCGRVHARFA